RAGHGLPGPRVRDQPPVRGRRVQLREDPGEGGHERGLQAPRRALRGRRSAVNPVDPSALTAALAEANLAVLVSAVAHLTGDLTLIDRYRDPKLFDHGRGPGSLPPAEADAIRAEAFAVLNAPEGVPERPVLDEASLYRILV